MSHWKSFSDQVLFSGKKYRNSGCSWGTYGLVLNLPMEPSGVPEGEESKRPLLRAILRSCSSFWSLVPIVWPGPRAGSTAPGVFGSPLVADRTFVAAGKAQKRGKGHLGVLRCQGAGHQQKGENIAPFGLRKVEVIKLMWLRPKGAATVHRSFTNTSLHLINKI